MKRFGREKREKTAVAGAVRMITLGPEASLYSCAPAALWR